VINRVLASGFLFGDGASAYTPAGVERVVFEAAIGMSDGERVSWHCEVEDAELVEKLRGRLGRGRVVFIEGELAARKFEKHGVQVGWSRFLRVTKCELPEGRSRAATDVSNREGGEK